MTYFSSCNLTFSVDLNAFFLLLHCYVMCKHMCNAHNIEKGSLNLFPLWILLSKGWHFLSSSCIKQFLFVHYIRVALFNHFPKKKYIYQRKMCILAVLSFKLFLSICFLPCEIYRFWLQNWMGPSLSSSSFFIHWLVPSLPLHSHGLLWNM